MTRSRLDPTRRASLIAVLGTALTACGGGGGGDASSDSDDQGTIVNRSLAARSNGTLYPLTIYIPPGSQGVMGTLPVIYLLDGETRFSQLFTAVTDARARVMIVAIGDDALRNRDYVPQNICTPSGGGQAAYFDFIRQDLTPFIESTIGGDPRKRILLGHSHGGSFVLYALFAEPAASHHFSVYLASDASIDCMSSTVYGWESDYAAANASLPVRLDISYAANFANSAFATQIESRHYAGLTVTAKFYAGGHIGMIPLAFADGVAFALG